MEEKISNFTIENGKSVHWCYKNNKVILSFSDYFEAYLLENRNEVLILSEINEESNKNLTLYKANGDVKYIPEMPKLKKPVLGVYTIIFAKEKKILEVVLSSETFAPFDTGCKFDVENGIFFDFHPSK